MLDNIIEFMKNNYEWLFSGIGLAIITMICKCLFNTVRKAKNIVDKGVMKKIAKKQALSPTIMTIVDDNGNLEQVEVVLAFEFKDDKQEYVVHTKHERDRHRNTTIYASAVDRSNGEPQLIGIRDDNEWKRVVEVLKILAEVDVNSPTEYDEEGFEVI